MAKLTGHSYRVLYLVSTYCVSRYFSLQQCQSSNQHKTQINKHVKNIKVLLPHLISLITFCDSPLYSASNNEFYVQAMSPDGEAIVTGAGDETLRFWNVFSKMRSTKVPFLLTFLPCIIISLFFFLSLLTEAFPYPSSSLLGICVSAEPLHQDTVVCTPLHDEGATPERDFIFACVEL